MAGRVTLVSALIKARQLLGADLGSTGDFGLAIGRRGLDEFLLQAPRRFVETRDSDAAGHQEADPAQVGI